MTEAAKRRGDTERGGTDPRRVDHASIKLAAGARAGRAFEMFSGWFKMLKQNLPGGFREMLLRKELRQYYTRYGSSRWRTHQGDAECARRLAQDARPPRDRLRAPRDRKRQPRSYRQRSIWWMGY